jgi:hypothetical protein
MRTTLLILLITPALVLGKDAVTIQLLAGAPLSQPIPSDMASFSWETPCALMMLGESGSSPRVSTVNLLGQLRAATGGGRGPNLRIGGNSGDCSAYIPNIATPLPTNDTYRITPADITSWSSVPPAFNGSVTVGLNFRNPTDPSLAVAHAAAVIAETSATTLSGFEIGNEPDLYFESKTGMRPKSYNFSSYDSEWSMYAAALPPGAPKQGLANARDSPSHPLDAAMPTFIKEHAGKGTPSFSLHYYPLDGNASPPPTIEQLLANESSAKVASYANLVQDAAQGDARFVLGEANSAYGGGAWNLSNTFASALWAIDTLFWASLVNISRINFHGCPSGAYTPIAYPNASDSADPPDVRPLFYGMLAFSHASANASAHAPSDITSTNPAIVAWPALGADGVYRVTVIHKDVAASEPALVTLSPPRGTAAHCFATVRTLAASGGAASHYGVTWDGRTFDGSVDGLPLGNSTAYTVPLNGASYASISVRPATAVLITFSAMGC